jgi:hypothetical protein
MQSGKELLTHFAGVLCLSSHFYIFSHSTVLPSRSLNLRDMVSSPKWRLLGCPTGRWSTSPSASWGRPEFEPRFLRIWWAVLLSLHWFLHLTGFCCASKALTPTCQEDDSPSGSSCMLAPGGITSWQSGGMLPDDKGCDNSPSLQYQIMSPPRNVVGDC